MPKRNPRKRHLDRRIERKRREIRRLEVLIRLSGDRVDGWRGGISLDRYQQLLVQRLVLLADVERLVELRDRKPRKASKSLPKRHPFLRKPHAKIRNQIQVLTSMVRHAAKRNDEKAFDFACDAYDLFFKSNDFESGQYEQELKQLDDLFQRAEHLVCMTPLERAETLADHRRASKKPKAFNPDFVAKSRWSRLGRVTIPRTKRSRRRLFPSPCECWLCRNAHLFDEKGRLVA